MAAKKSAAPTRGRQLNQIPKRPAPKGETRTQAAQRQLREKAARQQAEANTRNRVARRLGAQGKAFQKAGVDPNNAKQVRDAVAFAAKSPRSKTGKAINNQLAKTARSARISSRDQKNITRAQAGKETTSAAG